MPRVSARRPDRPPRVHFIGIGGTAMVAGARLALDAGWEVRGSDGVIYPPASQMVAELGIPVAGQYAPANLDWEPDAVVIGNVLSRGNAEVEAVLERRLRYVSLPEWLKENVLRLRRPIVITGTHGKTTTTALTAYLLDCAGVQPGFLVGGQPLDFTHSARLGAEAAPFVIEGDEYDTAFFDKRAKFFHYLPETAVVTSLEFDHGDIYRDIEEIEVAFQRMLRQIPRTGHLVLCADAPRVRALKDHAPCSVLTYGFDESADWRGELGSFENGLQSLAVHRGGKLWKRFRSPLAGRHNAANVLAALAVHALYAGEDNEVEEALARFKGIRRRMEVFHEGGGALFIDDFAHHPTAVAGTIAAVRARWPGHRLVALFEPRSNTSATNRFQPELGEALSGADEVWLGPIHRADAIPEDKRLDRATLVRELTKASVAANYTDDVEAIVTHLRESIRENDVVLIMSNGAFGGIYARIREVF